MKNKLFVGLVFFFCLMISSSFGAIAFDNNASASSSSSTTVSTSMTVSGDNRILFVAVSDFGGDTVTGVTFNGDSLTQIDKVEISSGDHQYLYYLVGADNGTHTLQATRGSTTSTFKIEAASYTGVNQVSPILNSISERDISTGTVSTTLNTVSDNSWTINSVGSTRLLTASTGTTDRGNNGDSALGDSGGSISPAQDYTMDWSLSSSGDSGIIMAAFTGGGTPTLVTNLTDFYNSTSINVSLNASAETNMSYIVNNSDYIISDGLVSYYNYNDGDFQDQLGFNNGTNNGTIFTQLSINQTYGTEATFNGQDRMITYDYFDFIVNDGDWTVCQWFYTKSTNQQILWGNSNGTSNRLALTVGNNDLTLAYFNGTAYEKVIGYDGIALNTWNQACAGADNGDFFVYINGTNATDTGLSQYANTQNNFVVAGQSGLLRHWNGSIDEIRVYNRSLSLSEANTLFEISPQRFICNDCSNNSTLITGLVQGINSFEWISRNNNFGNVSTFEETFIDLTAPELNVTNNSITNVYNLSFASIINVTDDNPFSCLVTTDEGNVTNCNSTFYNWTTNGNHTFNVSVNDSAGNNARILNNRVFVDPAFTVFFLNDSTIVNNFTVNGTTYANSFNGTVYTYGLGNQTFLFQKAGFNDLNFSLLLNETFSVLNQTIILDPAFINFELKDVSDGSAAPLGNYTFFITDESTGSIETHIIENNNTLEIANNYVNDTTISITVVGNTSVTSTIEIVTARQNVTIPIYITFESTNPRTIEVLTADLIAIPNTDVYLYTYISNSTFVLETIATTNVLGQVVFNIVENTSVYNICNTYQGNEKCLNQVIFVNAETDPFQIVHDSDANATEKRYLGYIEWSFSTLNVTNISEQMTMTFSDAQNLVSSFCYNVTRNTNGTDTFLGSFCNNNPSGQVVQTFGLDSDQYLEYVFYYVFEGDTYILSTYISYGANSLLNDLKEFSVLDTIFLILYFGGISLLISFRKFSVYNAGFLLLLLGIIGTQAFLQEKYVTGLVWLFLFLKTITFYLVLRRQ